ncbi:alkaline phosphatase family protein [Psychroserpens sp. MEBiC05023]
MKKIKRFIESTEDFPVITVFAGGLYPFLHYFNSNLHISNTWQQLLFMIFLCFVIPYILLFGSKIIFNTNVFKPFERYRLTFLNFAVFLVLIGYLIFSFKRKATALMIVIALVFAMILFKHIKKIVVLQFLMSAISLITFIPVLIFALNQNNQEWANMTDKMLNTELQFSPNIFVIQPDGYVNSADIVKAPYKYDNSVFLQYLDSTGFFVYNNFRSNYYSTMTSNSSMFSMKHNYYSNTYLKSLKTFNSNEVIIGKYNNVLKILNHNGYSSHLITDNSFFLVDRKPMKFDYCNVNDSKVSYVDCGPVKVDMLQDFSATLDTIDTDKNFFFIEKTIPGHIAYYENSSMGIEEERKHYLDRLEGANLWLKSIITKIKNFDNNALIIIVADHGGFVGLNYTLEATERQMTIDQTKSTFSSMLAIKWPSQLSDNTLEFKTSVNLFRTVFYALSGDEKFLNLLPNISYIPMNHKVYECINENDEVVFKHFDTP